MFSREFQALVRNARTEALRTLKTGLTQRELDVEEVRAQLQALMYGFMEDPGRRIIQRYTNTAYRNGLDWTYRSLNTQRKPKDFKLQISFSFTKPDQDAIRNLAALATADWQALSGDLQQRIVRGLVEADKKGAGVSQMVQVLQDNFQGLGTASAERIARTTTTQAYNQAAWTRTAAYAPFKEWIPTVTDDRTRESHRLMLHVIIPVDEAFHVPGFKPSPGTAPVPACEMMYPGDSILGAPLAQIINCRCALAPRFLRK